MNKVSDRNQLQTTVPEKNNNKDIYTERFLLLMRLIKTSHMISNAKIITTPEIKKH